MEKRLYICEFCQKEYEPTRRKAQKFCSSTCRSKNHHHKKSVLEKNPQEHYAKDFEATKAREKEQTKIEKMSTAGVGNSFWGSLAAQTVTEIAKNALKRDSDMPATKGDIEELIQVVDTRHFPIVNYQDPFNRKAFYDKVTCQIVLYNEQLNRMELP